jgi:hypothetical protein
LNALREGELKSESNDQRRAVRDNFEPDTQQRGESKPCHNLEPDLGCIFTTRAGARRAIRG